MGFWHRDMPWPRSTSWKTWRVVDETTDALRARILHGAWPPGHRLPTEHALAGRARALVTASESMFW